MEPKGFTGKLTAILSAGCRRLQPPHAGRRGATVKTLEAYKQIIYRSREAASWPGCGFAWGQRHAEFASVVDAVQCAVATQKEIQAP